MRLRRAAAWSAAVAVAAVSVAAVAGPTDAATTPAVRIGSTTVWEGSTGPNRTITFPVGLTAPTTTQVTVRYQVVTGTAGTADIDNLGGAVRTLTFPAGVTSRPVAIPVKPDTLNEADETFTVKLSSPTGATLAVSSAAGRILDDDPGSGVRIGVGNVTIPEGNTGPARTGTVWVTLSGPAASPVTAHAMTMQGTATEGSDYTLKMVDLTFAPGEVKKPFVVSVTPDTTIEPDEQLTVELFNVTGATVADAVGTVTVMSEERPNITTRSYLIGPFDLAAMGQPGWQSEGMRGVARPAGAIGIKGMRFALVNGAGTPYQGHDVHLHHVVFLDNSRTDAVCPSLPFNRFAGAGMEATPLTLGDYYAYRVGSSDTWSALWHVMNMTSSPKRVYIKYTIDYVAASSPVASRGVRTYWYDVDGCWGDSEFDVPGGGGPGSVYTKSSATYTAPRNGTRVAVGGHFHDGGLDVTLTRLSNNSSVCTNTGTYHDGMLHTISGCNTPTDVVAGEQYRTTVRYENDEPIAGAMGIQVSYVWEPPT
jgi:hypothetical protein